MKKSQLIIAASVALLVGAPTALSAETSSTAANFYVAETDDQLADLLAIEGKRKLVEFCTPQQCAAHKQAIADFAAKQPEGIFIQVEMKDGEYEFDAIYKEKRPDLVTKCLASHEHDEKMNLAQRGEFCDKDENIFPELWVTASANEPLADASSYPLPGITAEAFSKVIIGMYKPEGTTD